MKNITAIVVLLGSALSASAQDRIMFNDGQAPHDCKVVSLTFKEVRYSLDSAGTVQDVKAKLVKEIVFDPNNLPFDYSQGKTALLNGQWREAIEKLQKVIRDTRAAEPIKDYCRKYLIEAYLGNRDWDAAIAAAETLRKDRPESFFLKDSFLLQYQASKSKNDPRSQKATMDAFAAAVKTTGMSEWGKNLDILTADALEATKDFDGALRIYDKYARDAEVSAEAGLGALRVLTGMGKAADLKSRAQQIIDDTKDKKDPNWRVVLAAYVARGDAQLIEGKPKDALFDFMWAIDNVSQRLGEYCREHEAAFAKAAIAAARMAKGFGEKDKENKILYINRAYEMKGELDSKYPGSSWKAALDKELKDAEKAQ